MKKLVLSATMSVLLLGFAQTAFSDSPGPGAVPEVLFDRVLLVEYPGEALVPISIGSDKTIQLTEIDLTALEKSKTLVGSWEWDGKELCVKVALGLLCHALNAEMTPGVKEPSTVRYVVGDGQDQGALDVNVVLVR